MTHYSEAGKMRGFSTLKEQVGYLREFSENPQQRVRIGITSLDVLTEGPAAGEVYTIIGRSFSGKSLMAANIMANNPKLGILFFSLEMPARQALSRLYSCYEGVPHSVVIDQTKNGSLPELLDTLPDKLPKQVIVDRGGLTLGDLSAQVEQYEMYFECRPDCIIVDYLELVAGGSGDGFYRVETVAKEMKTWAKDEEMPVFLLHQTNRQESEWKPPTADSARGAGFTESDVVVGMWQPITDPDLGDMERTQLQGIVKMNVLKNRITGRTTRGKSPITLKMTESLKIVDVEEGRARRWMG